MKKSELVSKLAEKTGMSKVDVNQTLQSLAEVVTEAMVAGDFVQLGGIGTWRMRQHKQRNGINPKTGEKLVIPARKVPAFKVSSTFKKNTR